MAPTDKTPTIADYKRMADDLEAMSLSLSVGPEVDLEFVSRLAHLATEMRTDCYRVHSVKAD